MNDTLRLSRLLSRCLIDLEALGNFEFPPETREQAMQVLMEVMETATNASDLENSNYYVIYEDEDGKAAAFIEFQGGIHTESDVRKLTEIMEDRTGKDLLVLDWHLLT